jgi:phosphonate transport system substrate-binding protein
MMLRSHVRAVIGVLVILLVTSAAFASGTQEMEEQQKYGNLRLGLFDADGDLVADTPEDPEDRIDPDVLILSYTPLEDPEVYRDVWAVCVAPTVRL